MTAACCRPTTSCIWCRSASICRSRDLMEKIGFLQLTKVHGGFIPGTRRRTMDIPSAPRMLPLICLRSDFSRRISRRVTIAPGWIVNLTNDGWFGTSTGPYQHLQQARLRAIEEGLPLVRAANTGISAVIDPSGRDCRAARPRYRRRTGCQPAVCTSADHLCSFRRYPGRTHRGCRHFCSSSGAAPPSGCLRFPHRRSRFLHRLLLWLAKKRQPRGSTS